MTSGPVYLDSGIFIAFLDRSDGTVSKRSGAPMRTSPSKVRASSPFTLEHDR